MPLGLDYERDDTTIGRRLLKDNAVELVAGLTAGSLAGCPDLAGLLIEAPDAAAICKLLLEMSYAAPETLQSAFGLDEREAVRFADILRHFLNLSARLAELYDALPVPDIVMATDIESLIAGVIAKYKHGAQLVYDVDANPAKDDGFPETVTRFWLGVEKALIRHIDQGFAASKQIADHMSGRSGVLFRVSSGFPEALAPVEPRGHRGPDFRERLLEQVPEQLTPSARAVCEAYVGRHRLLEIKPLRINGAWTSRWNGAASRVDEIRAELVPMIGGTIGLSIELPYSTDVNCLFLSFAGCDPDTVVEVDSWGRLGSAAPLLQALRSDGDLFLPWNGNLASRLNVRITPGAKGTAPRLRSIRIFTASGISA
ncbi:hypothetical protein OIU35_11585 [Boseaceae bacterium BT-24-1]|nr:hypothetical protein [Boseaceae bacterium BT-24-1]